MVSALPEPWVPESVDLDEVDFIWQAIARDNPRAFDGEILHVLGVHRNGAGGVVIHVAPCAYRFYAVQARGLDCGVRTLGAKAITRCGDRILMGLRAEWVMYYPREWEFVPGGSVQPDDSPAKTILEELSEETGCRAVRPPVPLAVAYDPAAFAWEVIHAIELDPASTPVGSMEYDELRWFQAGEQPDSLTPIAQRMTALVDAG